ncbi:hypothetical protein Tco_1184135 [Tanacetum coccineum]
MDTHLPPPPLPPHPIKIAKLAISQETSTIEGSRLVFGFALTKLTQQRSCSAYKKGRKMKRRVIIHKKFQKYFKDVPPRPLNPQPLQSHPSLDITLSLSPITPLDHIHDTPSPPSQPQPQPPIMGHPLFYNYHDYHGSTCICCSHNRNLFFTLRDEMNIMFAHLEYLLTTAITSHFPPPP